MPARKKKEEEINLIPQRGFQATTAGRLLSWILSTFRVIVIVTEIIVMVAFLSRFYFDAQNSDLTEDIAHKQAVLSAAREFEVRFKDTQKRLQIFSELTRIDKPYSTVLTSIKTSLPADVLLISISSSKDSTKVTGITPNEKSVQQMIVNLSQNMDQYDVSLSEIGSKLDNPTLLEFVVEIKKEVKNT